MADYSVDGQDVLAVREVMATAVEQARAEQHPALIEVHTSRFVGHSMSDAASGTYRSKAELEEAEKRDPIALFRAHMIEAGELTEAEYTTLDDELKAEVQDAWDFADNSPEPPLEALYEHVLAESPAEAMAEA
jgi:pyruvate dehydrogenase E1 component alpha subunit